MLLKGRPETLTVLDYGLFKVHSNGRVIGICGFLIRTTAGEVVLVDGGFPDKYRDDIKKASREDDLGEFGELQEMSGANSVQAQLSLCGVTEADVTHVLQTHTHIDHIGSLGLCRHAPMIIGAPERALERPIYWAGRHPIDWPDRDYVKVSEDTRIGPGFDLYLAPGHTPGLLAFAVDLPDTGRVLVTGDAISRIEEFEEGFGGAWDDTLVEMHAHRLMALPHDMVIFGHSPSQWPRLRKAPLPYS